MVSSYERGLRVAKRQLLDADEKAELDFQSSRHALLRDPAPCYPNTSECGRMCFSRSSVRDRSIILYTSHSGIPPLLRRGMPFLYQKRWRHTLSIETGYAEGPMLRFESFFLRSCVTHHTTFFLQNNRPRMLLLKTYERMSGCSSRRHVSAKV